MEIRIQGRPEAVTAALFSIRQIFHVISESRTYTNRSSQECRVYLKVDPAAEPKPK